MRPCERPGRLLVLSPHCDDAVFACGQVLATYPGATVVTVFAGHPPPGTALTEWDQASGFHPGDEVMALRRAEDQAALTLLGAHPLWLEFCDSQYQCSPSLTEVVAVLTKIMLQINPQTVFFPLGLFHSDHMLVREAACCLLGRFPQRTWVMYEDALYRRIPGLVGEQIRRCEAAGMRLQRIPIPVRAERTRKRRAVSCYRSQLRALMTPGRPGYADAFAPECFWHVMR